MNGEDETNAPIQEESNEPGLDKPSSKESTETVAPVKKKRHSTPAQLETLRLAREKAAEIRALKRKEGTRKQDIDKKKRDEKNAEYQKRWDALKEKEKQQEALKEQKEQPQPVEESSEEEEKVIYKKKKKPSKKKPKPPFGVSLWRQNPSQEAASIRGKPPSKGYFLPRPIKIF